MKTIKIRLTFIQYIFILIIGADYSKITSRMSTKKDYLIRILHPGSGGQQNVQVFLNRKAKNCWLDLLLDNHPPITLFPHKKSGLSAFKRSLSKGRLMLCVSLFAYASLAKGAL